MGIVLLTIVLILHDTIVFPLALAGIIGIMLFELIRAIGGLQFKLATVGVMAYGILYPIVSSSALPDMFPDMPYAIISVTSMLCSSVCLTMIFWDYMRHPKTFLIEQGAFMIAAMSLVPSSIGKLIILNDSYEHGLFYVILGLCGAWIADSGAYFAGRAFGKKKLCPEISPKQTVEGFIGGLVSNAVLFIIIFLIYANANQIPFSTASAFRAGLLGLVCAAVSVLGDLTASVIKRQKGIKDYGNIMPGHGGLMDRFDSVLFVLPAFYFCITLLPIF